MVDEKNLNNTLERILQFPTADLMDINTAASTLNISSSEADIGRILKAFINKIDAGDLQRKVSTSPDSKAVKKYGELTLAVLSFMQKANPNPEEVANLIAGTQYERVTCLEMLDYGIDCINNTRIPLVANPEERQPELGESTIYVKTNQLLNGTLTERLRKYAMPGILVTLVVGLGGYQMFSKHSPQPNAESVSAPVVAIERRAEAPASPQEISENYDRLEEPVSPTTSKDKTFKYILSSENFTIEFVPTGKEGYEIVGYQTGKSIADAQLRKPIEVLPNVIMMSANNKDCKDSDEVKKLAIEGRELLPQNLVKSLDDALVKYNQICK